MFFALQIDHGSITQAVSETFLQDLNLDTNGEQVLSLHQLSRRSKGEEERLIPHTRFQPRQHYLPDWLHSCRVAVATDLQEDRPGPLDPAINDYVVHCRRVPGRLN